MTYQEIAIMDFLKGMPEVFVARREIARKALKRSVFEENPRWVDAPLTSLLEVGLLEQDESGHFRIKKQKDDEDEDEDR